MNGEQLHQTLVKLVNRVRTDSTDSLQAIEYLLNILQCLEQLKDPNSDCLLSECIESTSDLNNDLNSDSNSELNHNELTIDQLTKESDSGQQSSEEGSTTNDLKATNKKSLLDLILQLLSIIVNHLAKQVHNKQDAELLIDQWKNCLCFKQLNSNHHLTHTDHKNNQQQQDNNLLTNHFVHSSSGIQSDASCSPLSSLTTDCCANNLSTCSLSPTCCYSGNKSIQAINNENKKCSTNKNLSIANDDQKITNKVSTNSLPNNCSPTNIPIPPPLPPPLPNNQLDKSISNSSLNNQVLTSSLISNLSTNTPPQSINEISSVILNETPKPRSKMKTLNWNKISVHKVLTSHKPNIWSKLFSKKDDSKKSKDEKSKDRKEKNKSRKSHKKAKFSSDEENNLTEDEEFKRRHAFSSIKRIKKPDDNNNSSSTNSSTNNLSKLSSTINVSNSSINSTTTINSSSTKSKKQSEEDLMNIVQLDFDTLEGLFCQPNNNQVNNQLVGTMIANFSNSINNCNNNGSTANSCSTPNSPATNRRLLHQLQVNSQNQHLFNSKPNLTTVNTAGGNQLSQQQLSSYNQFVTNNNQLTNFNLNQLNSTKSVNYLNGAFSSQSAINQICGNGQLTNKLSKLNKLDGRNSPSALNYFGLNETNSNNKATLKRCSGEFNTTADFMHSLLDSKRSFNIDIFLKQFRSGCSNGGNEILRLVKQGDHTVFEAEKLVNLIKLLPDQTEIDLLKAHSDDLFRLPSAERFLVQLMAIPKYKLRLECMLLKAEYEANFTNLNTSLDDLINAAKELENCRKLHEVLYLILIAGNFLNSGGYAGEAAGFKMTSLLKLSEIRANKPNISLIHYVALQANKKQLSGFVNELSSVEKATKVSLELLKGEINSLANKIFKIKQQINSTNDCSEYAWNKDQNDEQSNQSDDDQINTTFFQQMREFLSDAEKQIKQLTQKVETDLEQIRTQLGEFLCEELNEFKLEECFRIFSCFITKFKLALEENAKRKDEFRLMNGNSKEPVNQTKNQLLNSKFKSTNELNNSQFNSLPRFKKGSTNKLFNSSSINKNLSIMNLAEENDLDPCLVEFLTKANELNGNNTELINGLTTFRRVGSGRKSFRQLNSNVFASNEIDFSSRERLNCAKITEEENKQKNEYDKDEISSQEQNDENIEDNSTNDDLKMSNNSVKLNSLSASNNELMKSNTPMAVIQPTLYSTSSSNYLSSNYSSNNYTNKILERAQSQLSLNSIGKSNKQVPIRSNPLTPLQTNSNGSLKRLNSISSYGSNDFKTYENVKDYDDIKDYDDLKNFKDYQDLKESSTNLKTCIQSLESLNNITSTRHQTDKSLNYQTRTRSLSKNSNNKSPLQSLNSYNSLKRGSSERHSFKYQVSSKVDCHLNPIAVNRNLYKENSQAKDDLLDSCKYILPKTSPVLSTLNRASILRMSLNRRKETKESNTSIFHSSPSSKSSSTTIRISTTTRPINLNPKKSNHYSSTYIHEPTYLEMTNNVKNKSTNSLVTIRPYDSRALSRVNSFRTTSSIDKPCHQSRTINRSNKNVHSTSAHSNTRQPRWVC